MEYLSSIPKPEEIPAGKVVVHNTVTTGIRPRRRPGYRGFRAWLAVLDGRLERCSCSWAPELGGHYRLREREES